MKEQNKKSWPRSISVLPQYMPALEALGLNTFKGVFAFEGGKSLTKPNLARYRSRIAFQITPPPATLYLKRFNKPPILGQIESWFWHQRKITAADCEKQAAELLASNGINTPKVVCFGEKWGFIFERKSFIITEQIPNAESLERRLPTYFDAPTTVEKLSMRRKFIAELAGFIRKFHATGYRHRDLYLCHIFHSDDGNFYLIDLARAFRPTLFAQRFRLKDMAQLYYSAAFRSFTKTDRLRFYLTYADHRLLTEDDKDFIRKVIKKVNRMAIHDLKHGRCAPFAQ